MFSITVSFKVKIIPEVQSAVLKWKNSIETLLDHYSLAKGHSYYYHRNIEK